ncbi:reverse transcriptase [Plakobranchus ocellatus]|uniref:Reverse transcriptase n=1 Tax=Plakobranchus ocellatus TaxID=259542 RepID=A0AAV4CCA3_9GAST|nr:reverse transcriptase [Plakobranchus ocellatus]
MSELDLYAKYLDLGVKLGRSGEDLTAWVEEKVRQDMERSDRQIERERKREEMEMQREEREMQKRREEIALQDRREEREMVLKRLELEAETKKLELGSRSNADIAGPKPSYATQRPKIPPLHDPSQVDLYLERFERHANAFGWPESEWASCLSNLLQDEVLSIFLSLSPAEGSDYQAVKRVLLQRFGYDRNGFRSKFLSVKPQEAEDFGTFINRARRYFDRDRGKPNVTNKNVGQGQFRPSSGSVSGNVTCFQCGGRGHFRRECPSHPRESNFSSLVPDSPSHSCECPSKPKEANFAFSVPELLYHCCAAKMDCNPRGALKIESCKVFDRVSTLLRDSGCNTTLDTEPIKRPGRAPPGRMASDGNGCQEGDSQIRKSSHNDRNTCQIQWAATVGQQLLGSTVVQQLLGSNCWAATVGQQLLGSTVGSNYWAAEVSLKMIHTSSSLK